MKKPALNISFTLTCPDPKIIALGGVATGSINAHESDIVAGIIISRGSIRMPTAAAPRIGSMSVAVAVFEVNSVRNVIKVYVKIISKGTGNTPSPANDEPIHLDTPATPNE